MRRIRGLWSSPVQFVRRRQKETDRPAAPPRPAGYYRLSPLPGPLARVRRIEAEYAPSITATAVALLIIEICAWVPWIPWPLKLALLFVAAVRVVQRAQVRARLRRSVGYYWSFPIAAVFVFVGALAIDGDAPFATIYGGLVLLVALAARIAYGRLTATWLLCITGAVLVGAGCVFAVELGRFGAIWLCLIVAPIVFVPVVAMNCSRRSAILAMVALPMASLTFLAMYGVRAVGSAGEGLCLDCKNPGMLDLAQLGFSRAMSALLSVTGETVYTSSSASDIGLIVLLAFYLYWCYLLLRSNRARMRDVIEVRQLGPDGDQLPSAPPAFQEALLKGRISVGDAGAESDENEVARSLLSVVRGADAVAGLTAKLLYRPSVRATLTQLPGELKSPYRIPGGSAPLGLNLLVEDVLSGSSIRAGQVRPPDLLADRPVDEIAAHQTLAYCLNSRGYPGWATWNLNGVGLGCWFEARRRRAERRGDFDGAVSAEATDAHVVAVRGEVGLLEAALEHHDPRALLLMLELGSRLDEVGDYVAAACIYLRAIGEYPQFPEAWLRLSRAYGKVAEAMLEGRSPGAEPAGYDLFDRRSIDIGARFRPYRDFAQETEFFVSSKVWNEKAETNLGWALREAYVRNYGSRNPLLDVADSDPQPKVFLTDDLPGQDRRVLVLHFALLSSACARRCQRSVYRFPVALRCAFIQSEREFWWSRLFSRFGLRRLSATARALDGLALTTIVRVPELSGRCGEWARQSLGATLGPTYSTVAREGTGWRAAYFLALFYVRLAEAMSRESDDAAREPSVARPPEVLGTTWVTDMRERNERAEGTTAGLKHTDALERARTLRQLAERRVRAERSPSSTWLLQWDGDAD